MKQTRTGLIRPLRWLGVITTVGMFCVLVMGATVTNTKSEQGCGHSWPLCHGKFVPQFATSVFIEWSHRAVVGLITPLILLLAAGALYFYRGRLEIRILAPVMIVFLFLQAGLGAWAVMYPQMTAILALHFGVSLVSFASVLLTAVFILEAGREQTIRDRPVPPLFKWAVWGLAVYSYVVVYAGAYVRHSNADDACRTWPLCRGSVTPSLSSHVGVNTLHRLVAFFLVLGIAAIVAWSYRLRRERPDIFRASLLVCGAVLLQALTGAIVVLSHVDLFSALAHAAGAGLVFGSLCYLCMHVLPQSQPERSPRTSLLVTQPSGAGR
ncbi:MAG TPA: COX15/CtaA family protein [Chloroflexota bacterium]